jgi:uncharacterized protein (TIGR02271 family)
MEEVGVARRSVTDGRTASASTPTSTEQEIRVPVIEEEVVITKRPVVKEELVIRTRLVTQEHVVEADVRRERVDVDREQR